MKYPGSLSLSQEKDSGSENVLKIDFSSYLAYCREEKPLVPWKQSHMYFTVCVN